MKLPPNKTSYITSSHTEDLTLNLEQNLASVPLGVTHFFYGVKVSSTMHGLLSLGWICDTGPQMT